MLYIACKCCLHYISYSDDTFSFELCLGNETFLVLCAFNILSDHTAFFFFNLPFRIDRFGIELKQFSSLLMETLIDLDCYFLLQSFVYFWRTEFLGTVVS